ncbi:MAG: hypothetical protein M3R66_04640 [Actinomycetota bacterium]|nr:hypothetical protein [Actinomycetota bacterium]
MSVRGQERGLIHTKRLNTVGAGRVVDQRPAVLGDRGHDRGPAGPELPGHRGHRMTAFD